MIKAYFQIKYKLHTYFILYLNDTFLGFFLLCDLNEFFQMLFYSKVPLLRTKYLSWHNMT